MPTRQIADAVTIATGLQLISFYNEHAIKAVKKFADRRTAEKRVLALIQDILDNTDDRKMEQCIIAELTGITAPFAHPDNIAAAQREIMSREAEGEDMSNATIDPFTSAIVKTPVEHRAEVQPSTYPSKHVPAISTSMKLDRRTVCLESGEVWSNAGKIWTTHGTEWMTYSQHDKLTKTLYSAAKEGRKVQYAVNGRTFELVAV